MSKNTVLCATLLIAFLISWTLEAPPCPAQEAPSPPGKPPRSLESPVHPVLSDDTNRRVKILEEQVKGLQEEGKYAEAILPARAILKIRQDIQGDDWWETGDARRLVQDLEKISGLPVEVQAELLNAESRYKEIVSLFDNKKYEEAGQRFKEEKQRLKEDMRLLKKIFGEEHYSLAKRLTLQASGLLEINIPQQAEQFFRKSLAIYRKRFGNVDHPSIAVCLYHVSYCLDSLGKTKEAMPGFERALAMARKCYVDQKHKNICSILHTLSTRYFRIRLYADAIPHFEALYSLNLKRFKKEDSAILAANSNNLALCFEYAGRHAEALPRWEESLDIFQRCYKNMDHPKIAACFCGMGRCLRKLGKPAKAIPRFKAGVEMYKKLSRTSDTGRIVVSMHSLGWCLYSIKRYEEARATFENALKMLRDFYKGRNSPKIADCLVGVGICLNALDKPTEALLKHEAALDIYLSHFRGKDHPNIRSCLYYFAQTLNKLYRYSEAQKKFEAALEMSKRFYKNQDHSSIAFYLKNLGICLYNQGREVESITKLEAALAMYQRIHKGRDHPSIVLVMLGLTTSLMDLGRFEEARVKLSAIHEMNNRLFRDRDHPYLVHYFQKNAEYLHILGRIDEALIQSKAALDMSRRLHGNRDHPLVFSSISWIAACLRTLGKPAKALIQYEEAMVMRKRFYKNQDNPSTALSLMYMGRCLDKLGRHEEALRSYESSVEMAKRIFGKQDNLTVGMCMNRLARCLSRQGRPEEALPLHMAALEMNKRLYDNKDNVVTVTCINNLGLSLMTLERSRGALNMFQAALDMNTRLYKNLDNTDSAICMNNVAHALGKIGKHAEAVPVYRASLAMFERMFPDQSHRQMPRTWNYLANDLHSLGRTEEAYRAASKSVQLHHGFLTVNYPFMSVREKNDLTHGMLQNSFDLLHTLSFQGHVKDVLSGLVGTLRMKGLVFEALCHERSASFSRVTSSWKQKFDRLKNLQRQYAAMALQSHSTSSTSQLKVKSMQRLCKVIKALDQELSRGNQAYADAARLRSVGISEVARTLSPGHALLEYVRYRRIEPGKKTSSEDWRYGIYVLVGGTGEVHALDLGPAGEIDASIEAFHKVLNDQIGLYSAGRVSATRMQKDEANLARLSSEVRVRIFDSVAKVVRGCHRLYVAPDGLLGTVPFEALAVKVNGTEVEYLLEDRNLEVVYLTTGRDLPRLEMTAGARSGKTVLLVGDPDFSASPAQIVKAVTDVRRRVSEAKTAIIAGGDAGTDRSTHTMGLSAEIASIPSQWQRLPETGPFLNRVKNLLEKKRKGLEVRVYVGCQAVEEAVLEAQSPRILQFATHGYFLKKTGDDATPHWFNPMLRSMLVLAGANTRGDREHFYEAGGKVMTRKEALNSGLPEKDLVPISIGDGLLTAYEVTGMDLRGTELVNMTACQSGLGQLTDVEGLAGLRSAFLLAGARSITMSLWNVPEEETLQQMDDFYSEWLGKGRARYASFRRSKLAALKRARENHGSGHPFWWAGFVYTGDPGDLPGTVGKAKR